MPKDILQIRVGKELEILLGREGVPVLPVLPIFWEKLSAMRDCSIDQSLMLSNSDEIEV